MVSKHTAQFLKNLENKRIQHDTGSAQLDIALALHRIADALETRNLIEMGEIEDSDEDSD